MTAPRGSKLSFSPRITTGGKVSHLRTWGGSSRESCHQAFERFLDGGGQCDRMDIEVWMYTRTEKGWARERVGLEEFIVNQA